MATMIHLDTHAVVWLAAGELERFAPSVQLLLEKAECAVSPMVRLELDYLYEIGRLKFPGGDLIQYLTAKIGLVLDGTSFAEVIAKAGELAWTRDPFDRIICATALVASASLLTKDATILANVPTAFWEQPP